MADDILLIDTKDRMRTLTLNRPKSRNALSAELRTRFFSALLEAEIQGNPISTHALVVDQVGKDEDGKPIEILFGALAMQQWGIRPIPDEERLDM